MLYLSLCLALLAIPLAYKTCRTGFLSALMALIHFLSLSLLGVYLVSDYLTGAGIDESVLYHLTADMGGAAFGEFLPVIVCWVVYMLAAGTTSISVFIHSRRRDQRVASPRLWGAFLAIGVSFLVNPAIPDIHNNYQALSKEIEGGAIPEQYRLVEAIDLPHPFKNVVFLYLESLERTYFDEALFPNLMPNLRRLEAQSLSFTNIRQVPGTGWTIAGMTASQCGIPLATTSGENSMYGVDDFLPGATCLGDLLGKNGYEFIFMGGADLGFAGKGQMLRSHGFSRVEGYHELKKNLIDKSYKSEWGLFDDSLFGLAEKRYEQLSKGRNPFALFLLTVDTHSPYGSESRSCRNVKYGDGTNRILNAVHCADLMAASFVETVQKSDSYQDTVIVVMSDHLAMRNAAHTTLERGDRRNLWMILGSEIASRQVSRVGTTLDVAPTLLNLLGAEVHGFGFGRDMLAEEGAPVLREGSILSAYRGFLNGLWGFPQLHLGMTADLAARKLRLGDRALKFPALLVLDDGLMVEQVKFDHYTPHMKLPQQLTELGMGQRFLWVDTCPRISSLVAGGQASRRGYCSIYGALGSNDVVFGSLDEGYEVDYLDLKKYFASERAELNEAKYTDHIAGLNNFMNFGTPHLDRVDGFTMDDFILVSAGYGAGGSFAQNLSAASRVEAKRGVTVFGLDKHKDPVKLAYLDTCGFTKKDEVGMDSDVQAVMDKYGENFSALTVIVSDSARCGSYDLSTLFSETDLKQWKNIGFRTPYVGLIDKNGNVREFFGEAETVVAVKSVGGS